jgi:fructokinase
METWVSGPALAADHRRVNGTDLSSHAIAVAAQAGDAEAQATLARHADRLARGLAVIVNLIDPDVIVLGGGLSNLGHLYEVLPGLMEPHIFSDTPRVTIRPPVHGDASGVRGAARLWDGDTDGAA